MIHSIRDILNRYQQSEQHERVLLGLTADKKNRILLQGLRGSAKALFLSGLLEKNEGLHLISLSDKDEAAYLQNDLASCLGDERVLYFPSSYRRPAQEDQTDSGNLIMRTECLNQLHAYCNGLLVVVSYPEAIAEKVLSPGKLESNTLHLKKGEEISIDFIREVMETYRFESVDFVYEPGQFAVRGSIVDIFSYASEYPYRIDFFGDEVESIRSFDIENQLSIQQHEKISIVPNLIINNESHEFESILKFSSRPFTIWTDNLGFIASRLNEIYDSCSVTQRKLHLSGSDFLADALETSVIEFGSRSYFPQAKTIEFNTHHQPRFNKNFTLLGDNLKMHLSEKFDTIILSENEKQFDRLHAIFNDTHQGIPFVGILHTLYEGFIDPELKICCYTDHQIFDRYHNYRLRKFQSSKASVSLKELKNLQPGDYIVHIDHGIGRFGGLEKMNVNGKIQESIRLVYRDNDVLYVNIHSLHRISKYKGKDDSEPKVYKLGTGAWQKLKDTTKKKVKDIAKDLIVLYAQRKNKEGFRFTADTYLQEELEASFIYEDTPDQVKATQAVKSDMESATPMDRLVCGDVGFGKTEIAVRAAFKAVADNKQVAILVPTTILALQHYRTFRDRLQEFPCKVDYLSRLRSPNDQKMVLEGVQNGSIDVLIGTHRLLGKDLKFKDLGLLIIDEEQKFGVGAKEKLRSLKVDVDTLTMTATPIPRTLQFSMMGARDLSIINTPPPNRHPIVTELHTFNETIIQESIQFEISRGGQVFFIHNRVQNIYEVEALIRKLCPHVNTVVGHGQMEGPKLEKIMTDFINGDYDILIATTIIESGLDIPNANTILINNAQNFGLSDLHQLRGRVGRSNKKAFCYLLAPPLTTVTPEARRRLKAIEELSDLGSGFNIAMQDLDIRGAGNMLGAEQSGFIADIGFETYNRILNEAILELKENEFRGLYEQESSAPGPEEPTTDTVRYVMDCTIETDMEIHIPDEYVQNVSERIALYRQVDSLETEESLELFRQNLTDRFGPIPQPASDMLDVVRLRRLAENLGFEKLILKSDKLVAHFISNQQALYYSSPTFARILNFVQKYPSQFRMKEGNNKLTLAIDGIVSVHQALEYLRKFEARDNVAS